MLASKNDSKAGRFIARASYAVKFIPKTFYMKFLREVSIHEDLMKDTIELNGEISALYRSRSAYLNANGIASTGRFFNHIRLAKKSKMTLAITDELEIYAKRNEETANIVPPSNPKRLLRLTSAARARVRQAELAQELGLYAIANYKFGRAIEIYRQCQNLIEKGDDSDLKGMLVSEMASIKERQTKLPAHAATAAEAEAIAVLRETS